MGIVIRQSFYSSIFSYLGAIIGFVNVLILFPAFLTEENIGLYRAIQNAALLLLPFAQFGLHASTLKFFPEMDRKENGQRQFLGFMLIMVTLFYLLFLFLYFIFENQIHSYFQERAEDLVKSFHLVLVLVLVLSFQTVIESYSRSLLKTVFPNFLRDFFLRFLISISILLYAGKYITFNFLLNSLVGIYFLVLIILIIYLAGSSSFSISFPKISSFGDIGKRIINYSMYSFIGFTGSMIILNVDSVMVSSMLGLAKNGIYVTAFYMGLIIELPRRALNQITTPLLAKGFEENNHQEVQSLYKKTSLNQGLIGSLLMLGVLVNLDNIFLLMPQTEIYSAGKYVVIFIALAKLIDMIAGQNGEIILFSRYFRFNVLATIILGVLTILSNLILIPRFDINGAALASLISLFLFNLVKMVFVAVKLNMQPFSLNSLKVVLITIFTYFAVSSIPRMPLWVDLTTRSLLIIILFTGLVLLTKASDEITSLAKGGWKKLF